MSVGVRLRTQIVDATGAPSGLVQTGGAFRVHAANLGIISFQAHMSTKVIGKAVTDRRNSEEWAVALLLAGSPGAKTEDQKDTELVVIEANKRVAFRTECALTCLFSGPRSRGPAGHYESAPLDLFGTTT